APVGAGTAGPARPGGGPGARPGLLGRGPARGPGGGRGHPAPAGWPGGRAAGPPGGVAAQLPGPAPLRRAGRPGGGRGRRGPGARPGRPASGGRAGPRRRPRPGGGGAPGGGGGAAAARRLERRTPLAVPGGRGADDPETLAAWMGTDGVLVLVDGYNVTKHPQGFPDRGLEDQRTLLPHLRRRLARRFGADITVVFDGGTVGPIPTRLGLGPVEVVFTDAGRTPDDEIVARTNAAPRERPVVVVTSDNELRS